MGYRMPLLADPIRLPSSHPLATLRLHFAPHAPYSARIEGGGVMRDFAGKVAVITGGASGIGNAMARRFAAEGMKLVLGDIDPVGLERAVGDLRAQGAEVTGIPTDVSKIEDIERLAAGAIDAYGKVHV